GLALARWGLALVRQSGPQELLRLAEIRLDGPVLAFAAGLVVATTLLFGLLPALGASRRAGALGQASRSRVGASHGRLREGLIVVEIALGLALLVNAGLLVRSLGSLMRVSPGFSAQGVLSASLNFPPALLPEEHQVVERMEAIESALAARPGIEAVGATRVLPLSGNQFDLSFVLEGQAVTPGQEPAADFRAVTPGYFGTLAIPLRRGRLFTAADRDGATPVALVSERFVEQFFPGQDPLGRRMKIGDTDQDAPWWTIVGVVGGVRDNRLDRAPDAEMYIPNAQHAARRMRLVVRSPLPTAELVREVRQAVASVDPHQVVSGMVPMAELVDRSLASARFLTSLLGVFAVLALVLAVVGVYGVVAYSMGLRRQEMAVRLALGATREAISQLVLGWGARRLVLGLVGGLALALAMARALASLLYRVAPWDPATL
ncbi:MAG TPA: ABC transporter permease, partial [Thermoanaerobaculia bacterium]|nr:ABC transporter permease [Thermoanaerobaculia bacterium]